MTRLESQQQRLVDHMDGSVAKTVNAAVGGLITELYGQMQKWESQMGTQTQMQSPLDILRKEVGEPNCAAENGVTSAAECRLRLSTQTKIKMDGKDGDGRQDCLHQV